MLKEQLDIKFYNIEGLISNDEIIQKICNDNSNCLNIYWLGTRFYNPIWDLQKAIHKLRVNNKINDVVFLLEHNHVYTLGKNADENHILSSSLEKTEIIKIDRGGDVTYHGPGQLVGYPILDLHNYKMSISWYLDVLSNSIINMLADLDINSHYRDDYVGVWVDESKIAAFGVRLSKWITMHGFALNINTNLKYYDGLIPCGIFECGITSVSEHIETKFSVQEIAKMYSKYFIKHLNKEV
jgi:lipoyl(octanoyl) transferase